MAIFAIGDVQGCYKSLRKLIKQTGFKPATDKLWFCGDLVNRGPQSADVLRYIMDLGDSAKFGFAERWQKCANSFKRRNIYH